MLPYSIREFRSSSNGLRIAAMLQAGPEVAFSLAENIKQSTTHKHSTQSVMNLANVSPVTSSIEESAIRIGEVPGTLSCRPRERHEERHLEMMSLHFNPLFVSPTEVIDRLRYTNKVWVLHFKDELTGREIDERDRG
jgi:hypothetical protein